MEAKKLDMKDDVEKRVRAVVARTFKLPLEKVSAQSRMGSHPSWDSMGHMELLSCVEREFGIRFPTILFSELTGVEEITRAIVEKRYE